MSLNPDVFFKCLQDAQQLRPVLDVLERSAFNCSLHKAINKLAVIRELLVGTDRVAYMGYQPLVLRSQCRVKVLPPEMKYPDEHVTSLNLNKHVGFLLEVLEETSLETDLQGTHAYLEYFLASENLRQYDDRMVKQENDDSMVVIKYLKEKLESSKKNTNETKDYLKQTTGECFNKAMTNVWAQEKAMENYTRMKQDARVQFNSSDLKEREKVVKHSIDSCAFQIEEEMKVHNEIHAYLELLISELEQKLDYWTERYNMEIEKLDVELLQTKSKSDEQRTMMENTLLEYKSREKEMEELLAEMDERDVLARTTRAAMVIQRWWKDIMFMQRLRQKIKTIKPKKRSIKKKKK